MVINKIEKLWKEEAVVEFTIISHQIPGLTEENKEYSHHRSRLPGQDMTRRPAK